MYAMCPSSTLCYETKMFTFSGIRVSEIAERKQKWSLETLETMYYSAPLTICTLIGFNF
jgi:hypothetical protein